jgi:hypothetical protein
VTVASALPGAISVKAKVAGGAVYIATLSGLTDGVPPGAVLVADPGQTTVRA